VTGRQRFILVDVLGYLIRVVCLAANIQEQDGATDLLALAKLVCPKVKKVWGDSGFAGWLVAWVKQTCDGELEVVHKLPDQQGFVVLPHRWIVERTLAWISANRRLSKDYEEYGETTEAWVYLAMIRLMLRRRSA
jgi:putative transposase